MPEAGRTERSMFQTVSDRLAERPSYLFVEPNVRCPARCQCRQLALLGLFIVEPQACFRGRSKCHVTADSER